MNKTIQRVGGQYILYLFTKYYEEGLELRRNNRLEEAFQKFKLSIEIDRSQFKPYREIFEIMMILKYDYFECFSQLLQPLNYDSIDSLAEQIDYLDCILKNNDQEQILVIQQIFLNEQNKTAILFQITSTLMKEKKFIQAKKYFDLYQICVSPDHIPFTAGCLIYACKNVFDQEEAYKYLNNQLLRLDLSEEFKEALDFLIQQEFLKESLNISLFFEKKYNNLNCLSELEQKLSKQIKNNNDYIQRNLSEILQIYEIVIEKFPAKLELFKNLSLQLFQIKHDSAYFYSKKYLELCHHDYLFHFDLGQIYSSKNDYNQAIFHFEKIIEIYIREVNQFALELSNIFKQLGDCYYEINQFKKAAFYFEKYLLTLKRGEFFQISSIKPINSKLANSYLYLNQYQKCFEILPQTDFSSNSISIFLSYIHLFCNDESIKKKVISYGVNNSNNHPECFLSHIFLIDQLKEANQLEMSSAYMDRCEIIYLKNPEMYDSLQIEGQMTQGELFKITKIGFLIENQKLDEAEKTALELYQKTNSEFSIISLVRIYKKKGETAKQKVFEDLINNLSESRILYAGRLMMKDKQYSQAIYFFKSYYKFKKNDYSFYKEFGFCQECLGYSDQAIKSYKIYLKKVQSDDIEVLSKLANIMLNQGQIEQAKKYFKKCIKLNSNYAIAYQELGLIAKKKKEYEKAKQLFEFAVSLNPQLLDSLLEVIDIELQWIESVNYEKLSKYLEMARNINSQDKRISQLSLLLKIKQQKIQ